MASLPALTRPFAAILLAACAPATMRGPGVPDGLAGPLSYVALPAAGALAIDGRIDEVAWRRAAWTSNFVDIEGAARATPRFVTRAKMLWDDRYWYIAAELQEPDLWATIREHDAVIFHDNDFELFIDPSGSGQRYFEIEVNQFGTVWDLYLPRSYREGGHAVNSWNIDGLRIATGLRGTINNPGDHDRGWTVELAIPWSAFADSGRNMVPPHAGDQWRLNFSRVEWDVVASGGQYARRRDTAGKLAPEHNWVWSPQGVINMHVPEKWGYVRFESGRAR